MRNGERERSIAVANAKREIAARGIERRGRLELHNGSDRDRFVGGKVWEAHIHTRMNSF